MSHRNEITDDKTGQKVTLPVVAVEPDTQCEFCPKVEETRPYGPGGKRICFDCATATPEMKALVEHNMGIQLFGKKGELK